MQQKTRVSRTCGSFFIVIVIYYSRKSAARRSFLPLHVNEINTKYTEMVNIHTETFDTRVNADAETPYAEINQTAEFNHVVNLCRCPNDHGAIRRTLQRGTALAVAHFQPRDPQYRSNTCGYIRLCAPNKDRVKSCLQPFLYPKEDWREAF